MNSIIKLKENYEFRRVYTRGKAFVTPFFVIYVMKTRRKEARLGITAGKKLGGAVSRNRAKRVVTAAFRKACPHIKGGFDFVIVARTRILNIKSTTAAAALEKQLKSAGVWIELMTDEQAAD